MYLQTLFGGIFPILKALYCPLLAAVGRPKSPTPVAEHRIHRLRVLQPMPAEVPFPSGMCHP